MDIIKSASANVQRKNSIKVRHTHVVHRPFRIVKWKPKKRQVRSIGFTVFTINCTAIISHLFRFNKKKLNG